MASITRTLARSSLARSLAATRPVRTGNVQLQRQFASGDYGSGAGDPKGEQPQKQGPNPSADKEHPGPPPPKAGQGSGGSTKATSEGHEKSSQNQGQKRNYSTSTSAIKRSISLRGYHTSLVVAGAEQRPKSTEGLSPKILNESPPAEGEQPDDVKQHNQELSQRAERAHEQISNKDAEKDKVSPKFWSGQGGQAEDAKH